MRSIWILLLLAACEPRLLGEDGARLDAEGLETLRLDVGAGDLFVYGEADATEIRVEVKVWAAPGVPEDEGMDALDLALETTDEGRAFLGVAMRDPYASATWVDVRVTVPDALAITGLDRSGDARFEDVAGIDFEDDSGDLSVLRVSGDVRVHDGSGDLSIMEVGGSVLVVDDSGDVVVRDVAGDVEIEDGSGDVDVDGVVGTFTAIDDSGDIHVGEVGDFVLVSDTSGDVTTRP